jgi:hypothetical protein
MIPVSASPTASSLVRMCRFVLVIDAR